MRAYAEENPRVERPVYHFGLSLSPGEHLTPEQWNAAVDRVLARMGLAGIRPWSSRTATPTGSMCTSWSTGWARTAAPGNAPADMVKAYEAVHEIEAEHGLTPHRRAGRSLRRICPRAPTRRPGAPDSSRSPIGCARRRDRSLPRRRAGATSTSGSPPTAFRLESAERGSGVVVTDGSDDGFALPRRPHLERTEARPALRRDLPGVPGARPGAPGGPGAGRPRGRRAARRSERRGAGRGISSTRVSATRATFTEADVERAAFLPGGQRGPGPGGLARRSASSRSAETSAAASPLHHARVLSRSRDPALLLRPSGSPAATTPRTRGGRRRRSSSGRAPHLSDEQREAVFHATTGGDLAQIVGRAGAGKTTVARTIAEAYREEGYEVRGAALAGKAAEGLEQEAGIPSRTLASLERAWKEGRDRLARHLRPRHRRGGHGRHAPARPGPPRGRPSTGPRSCSWAIPTS